LIPLVQATDMDAALKAAGVETFLRVIPGPLHSRQYLDYVVDEETGLTVLQECLQFMHDHIG
jgi:dipeptidyl aminopeptidase/acylaminoacyl peptidase